MRGISFFVTIEENKRGEKMSPEDILSFLHLCEKLKGVTRHAWTSNGTHESVASHSWRLGIMAMCMGDHFKEADMNKVIRMCLIHDLGEAITQDIPAFMKTKEDEDNENQVWHFILSQLNGNVLKEFEDLFHEMNDMATAEAKVYKFLDKCEALIQHNEGNISTWLDLEYDLQYTYGIKECQYNEFTQDFRKAIDFETDEKIKKEGK